MADRKGQGPGRVGVAQMRTPTGLFSKKKTWGFSEKLAKMQGLLPHPERNSSSAIKVHICSL